LIKLIEKEKKIYDLIVKYMYNFIILYLFVVDIDNLYKLDIKAVPIREL